MKRAAAFLTGVLMASAGWAQLPDGSAKRLIINKEGFLLDGRPLILRSGEMHYPRVPRECWRDRMKKARALGLNAICTYVFWNLHEPRPGQFDFTGNLDLAEYLRIAQQEGLFVLLRPGPYICTEWDMGGFPSWLWQEPDTQVRSTDPRFLAAAERYLRRVGQEVAGLQSTKGGPILMVQVENEYGSFGADKQYLEAIRRAIETAGFEVPLYTSDGPRADMLANGALPDLVPAINFGADDDIAMAFRALDQFRKGIPRMVGEYWVGWFDHWGREHHTVDPQLGAKGIEWMLSHGVSFNLYMFHGGTNWGFSAGANDDQRYWPDTTSYDYDAVLDEAGRPTPKFAALRDVIARFLPVGERLPELPAPLPIMEIPRFRLDETAELTPLLGEPVRSETLRTMESWGQSFGYVLYRTTLDQPRSEVLEIREARDYAVVLQARKTLGRLDRRLRQCCLDVTIDANQPLDILVEAMGRVNFGPRLVDDRKGITEKVTLGGRELKGWQIFPLPMTDLSRLRFSAKTLPGPAFYRGRFSLSRAGDTFFDLRGWGKGVVWVNGHNLGRFWCIGPQQTLYCPATFLKTGTNQMIVFDLEGNPAQTTRGLVDPVNELRAARSVRRSRGTNQPRSRASRFNNWI